MKKTDTLPAKMKEPELTITRILNASRELVFKHWTDSTLLAQWWGPNGFTNPICEMDLKPGGSIYIDMKGPDGIIHPMHGRFIDIVKPERLVFVASPLDENGLPLFEVLNTVTFAGQDGKTKLTLHTRVSNVKSEGKRHLDGMEIGCGQSLDRLTEVIESRIQP